MGTSSSPAEHSEKRRHRLRFREFVIDLDRASLWRSEEELKLRPKSFEVLRYLVEHPRRLVPKAELLSAVWFDSAVTDNSLVQCLLEIRRALGDHSQGLIKTVSRRGYLFEADVTEDRERATGLTVFSPSNMRETGSENLPSRNRGRLFRYRLVWFSVFVTLLTGIVLAFYSLNRTSKAERFSSRTLAVLPFQPVGAASRDEYLELGMADALITRLSTVQDLVVRPTSSVRQFSDSWDAIGAGKRLGVGAVVDGTIQRLGDRLRVNVRLVRVEDGKSLWAESYDESFRDIFSVQDAVSTRVARALTATLTGKEIDRLNKRYTHNAEAFELYTRGRYFWGQRSMQALRKAISYFEQATQKDPNYALAYAGLAFCYGPMLQRYLIRAKDGLPKLNAAASKAVELDGSLAEAHVAMGAAEFNDWNFSGAENESRRAIDLNPNDSTAHAWYGYYLGATDRRGEYESEMQRAYELDPLSPGLGAIMFKILWSAGREKEAFVQLRKAAEIDPGFPFIAEYLGEFYASRHLYREALEEYGKTIYQLRVAWVEAASGRQNAARRTLAQFLQATPRDLPLQEMNVAALHVALGESDEAFRWLERAYAEHDPGLMFLKVDPRFESLRPDPRYRDFVRRLHLAK